MYYLCLSVFICGSFLFGGDFPVAYQGRIRPAEAYAKLWMHQIHHTQDIENPLDFLWQLNWQGHQPYDDYPLFWIRHPELRKIFNAKHISYQQFHKALYDDPKTNHTLLSPLLAFTFYKQYREHPSDRQELTSLATDLWIEQNNQELSVLSAPENPPWHYLKRGMLLGSNNNKTLAEEILNLIGMMQRFEQLTPPGKNSWQLSYEGLVKAGLPPQELALRLEVQSPLSQRIKNASALFKVLPGKTEWYPLNALALQVYDPVKKEPIPVKNFTLYPDVLFEDLQQALLLGDSKGVMLLLQEGAKSISSPSPLQLEAERIYASYPFIQILILIYIVCACCLLIPATHKMGSFLFLGALMLHTIIFFIRWYILQRPPVSNMYETVIYVPWLAGCLSVVLARLYKTELPLLGASILSGCLLSVLVLTQMNDSLENVQAVLDSHFWLIIHVLMIVGSYGILLLAGVLGHLYLLVPHKRPFLGPLLLQTLYIGVALLIPGTLLGGVWAAESWGRFWDWDPKESWAFISSCIYLVFIHGFRFNYLSYFGLAIGSILGLMSISFTWYGVNYILGTGLHSYGFGSGGEFYYYLFLIFEVLFIIILGKYGLRKNKQIPINTQIHENIDVVIPYEKH